MLAKAHKAVFWIIITQTPTLLLICLCSLLDFHCIIYHQIHELIEALCQRLDCSTPELIFNNYTLILPSIRIANCSKSHIDTVERCCRSLKMKLIGGKRTFPLPPPPPPPPPRPVIVLPSRRPDIGDVVRFECGSKWSLWIAKVRGLIAILRVPVRFSDEAQDVRLWREAGRILIRRNRRQTNKRTILMHLFLPIPFSLYLCSPFVSIHILGSLYFTAIPMCDSAVGVSENTPA